MENGIKLIPNHSRMSESKSSQSLAAAGVVLAVVALAVAGYAVLADDADSDYDQVRYTVYFGMGDRDDAEVQDAEGFIVDKLEKAGFGYNLERETGGYMDGDTPMKDRVTLKFVITDRDEGTIYSIIDDVKEGIGINTVFLEKDLVKCEFC